MESPQLDGGFMTTAASFRGLFGHALDAFRNFCVQGDGYRVEVGVEKVGVDPQRYARILVAQYP